MLFAKYILLRKPDDHFQEARMKMKATEAEVYLACARSREEEAVELGHLYEAQVIGHSQTVFW